MFVNVEFLGNEPIENVITALNYKIDKTIFFGYKEIIEVQKQRTDNFLKKYCGVKQTEYVEVSHTNIKSVIDVISAVIEKEYNSGNKLFFDITGGESLILVAFGIIAAQKNVSLHMYDVRQNKLIEYSNESKTDSDVLSKCALKQHITMDIGRYIEMHGGIINCNMQKEIKSFQENNYTEKTGVLWSIMMKHKSYWNSFSHVLKVLFKSDDNLKTYVGLKELENYFKKNPLTDDSLLSFGQILKELEKEDILRKVNIDSSGYSFIYNGCDMKYFLWDCGSILEFHTYNKFAGNADDCKIGVHIDWDGIINNEMGSDVLNEIDVLALNGYIPTFISCKSGKMGSEKSLHALYELETVASRFGKKYAKKILVLTEPLSESYQMRADEMGIEVIVE